MDEFEQIKRDMIALLPRLRAFARSLTRDPVRADDLVQQSCEKALRNLAGFTPGTRLDSWMFRIMRNAWIDDRRAPRHLEMADNIDDKQIMSEDGTTRILARLELQSVIRAMAAMDQDQREVLMLIGVDGMRYRDAAEALELPIGTVMSRLSRARKTLAVMVHPKTSPTREEKNA